MRGRWIAQLGYTVTITNSTISGYQRGGLVATGNMTMNVSGSTIGPPDNLGHIVGQNGIQFGTFGAGGSITNSTIIGSSFLPGPDVSTAILLTGAGPVTVANSTITGDTDIGIAVTDGHLFLHSSSPKCLCDHLKQQDRTNRRGPSPCRDRRVGRRRLVRDAERQHVQWVGRECHRPGNGGASGAPGAPGRGVSGLLAGERRRRSVRIWRGSVSWLGGQPSPQCPRRRHSPEPR